MKDNLLVLGGAVAGGILGYLGFIWLVKQGLYGLILPGGLLGIGAGMFPGRSLALPVVCGVMALCLGIFSEWRVMPFIKDDSLGYFLAHLHELRPVTLLLIGVGAAIGFWVPFRRAQDVRQKAKS